MENGPVAVSFFVLFLLKKFFYILKMFFRSKATIITRLYMQTHFMLRQVFLLSADLETTYFPCTNVWITVDDRSCIGLIVRYYYTLLQLIAESKTQVRLPIQLLSVAIVA